ncbi:MAG: undecaprenyl/decaprenyl-phosphate alpha-N-acetylglucosaminyl 1-phosphate transferase [Deltaproteobacteria bacterium]|nr:undecaprenyl/decaprenyl-phosphate alpha-N-acetylglucosaminyl 1-phosphate transferase [Deltaproteobacteria bacterium]
MGVTLGLGAGAALASTLLTWVARQVARRVGFVAPPNPIVPSHTHPVAYMGGTGIAAAALLFVAGLWGVGGEAVLSLGLGVGSVLFLLIGLWDDLIAPGPRNKLLVQLVASVAVAWSLRGWLPPSVSWAEVPLGAFVIVSGVNAVNLTDVADGLVGGLAVVAFGALALLVPGDPIPVVMVGAVLGFLVWNRAPASIYLGDAGSHLIGALLAVLSLQVLAEHPTLRQGAGLAAIMGVFIFELGFLTVVRARKGLPFWRGSPDHFALRLQAGGFSRQASARIGWTAGAILAGLGLLISWAPAPVAYGALAVWAMLVVAVVPPLLRWEVRPKQARPAAAAQEAP